MSSSGELLSVEPQELKFPFELKKQISSSLQLSNNTENYIAFKVKTTNPKKYCVRPNTGVVLPRSTSDVIVTMQSQREFPLDMQCKDKFLLQSVIAAPGAAVKDITTEMFSKESGNLVEECKLRVLYVSPPQPPSPVPEGSEEGSSPRGSISENGNFNGSSDFTSVPKSYTETEEPSSEEKAMILKLTEEKKAAIQQANQLRQELELMRRESQKSRGGISFLYVVLIALFGVLLGYILRKK
ncbi:Vesicle-associated protein 1-2 [Ranunculus cassubicifolius]